MPSVVEPVDCVILDLFGVVVAFDDALVYDRLAARCPDRASALNAMQNLVSDPDLIRGKVSLEDLRARLTSDIGLDMPMQEFRDMWAMSYSEPNPGMREALTALSQSCRLVLLSNVDMFYWPTLVATIPELALFDACVLSWETGKAKPEVAAFELAVRAAAVPTTRCCYFDDKAENVHVATSVGLHGYVFTSCHAMKRQLRSHGVLV